VPVRDLPPPDEPCHSGPLNGISNLRFCPGILSKSEKPIVIVGGVEVNYKKSGIISGLLGGIISGILISGVYF